VVNGSPKVCPEVRAQVERAVAKLGYVPNRAARLGIVVGWPAALSETAPSSRVTHPGLTAR
jgi:hypothetical protein